MTGKLKTLKNNHPLLDVYWIAEHDPSKTNKYVEWMIKQVSYFSSFSHEEYLNMFNYITFFHDNQQRFNKKDIYQFKSLKELQEAISKLGESNSSKKKKKKIKGAEKISTINEYDIYHISTHEASLLYGSNTQWCINSKEPRWWTKYLIEGNLFYFAVRKYWNCDSLNKIAFIMNHETTTFNIFDSKDEFLYIDNNPTFANIVNIIKQDAAIRPRSLEWKICNPEQVKFITKDEIKLVLEKDNPTLFEYMAYNFNLLPELLIKLSSHESFDIRYSVTINPNTPKEILMKLAKDQHESIRSKVAENPNISSEILEILARDTSSYVRCRVAKKISNKESIMMLANDDYWNVRAQLAQNKNLTEEVFLKLYNDKEKTVRLYLAQNSNIPEKILIKLANDKDLDVQYRVAQNSNVTEEILILLSKSSNEYIRSKVAGNPNTPKETLKMLSNDGNNDIRFYVAMNPNTPKEVLMKLIDDENYFVREAACNKLL